MLPLLIVGIVIVSIIAITAIFSGPTKANDTFNEVQARLQREEALAAQKLKNEQEARVLEEERKQVQKLAAEQRRRVMMQMMMQKRVGEQRTKIFADQKAHDDEVRNKKEEERVAKQKIEEEQRELVKKMKELKVREQKLQEEVEKANQIAIQERAAAKEGLGPLRWPTREEFQHALQATQYNHTNFHFAIVGRAGSGKSSLINAFRNLRNIDPKAAPTGTKETTLKIGRYPDPGDQPPRQWMVWFDVPGAGTQRISHYDYFIKQGLYVFDLIILAIGDRFEEIDVRILENCKRFKIPAFIVRSKADMHILNSMKEYGDYTRTNDNPTCYEKCQDTFIIETQQTVSEGLIRQGLPDQHVYIVSRDVLRRTYNDSLESPRRRALKKLVEKNSNVIHESQLVKDLLTVAAQRRCDTNTEQTPLDWVKDGYSVVQECFSNRNHGQPSKNSDSDLADFFAVRQDSQASQNTVQTQPTHHFTRYIRKVIYPRQPTDAQELYEEMAQNSPELPNMLVGHPRMFNPQVAMLTFYPLAPIPRKVFVFGARLWVQEYKEKKTGATRKGRGGHIQPAETEWTASEVHGNIPVSARAGAHFNREGNRCE